MIWEEYQLGELIHIKHGYAFKSEFFAPEGNHIVLTPGNFHEEGGFKLRGDRDRYYTGSYPSEYLLMKGDLIVAMTEQGEGLLGSSALIPESNKYLHNQRLGLVTVKDSAEIDIFYLYKIFNTEDIRHQISASASGVKVRHTSPDRIYKCKVNLPPLPIQQKIAGILSVYDDLIENNLKRIKLLEEMAQITYEEWFVRLRFPGYESIPINPETGLPEGWNKSKLKDLLTLNYGKSLVSDTRIEGNVPVYGSSGVVGWHNESIVNGPGIIVGRKGNVGSVFWSVNNFYPIDTVYYVTSSFSYYFLYYVLKNTRFINNDAAVPGLNRDAAYAKEAVKPTNDLIVKFEAEIVPAFKAIDKLSNQNKLLSEARDILLPRLMTGVIDVEQYDPADLLREAA